LSLRSDADNADWIIRCLCCSPRVIYPLDIGNVSGTPDQVAPTSGLSISHFIGMNGGGPTATWPPAMLLAVIYNQGLVTVNNVDDDRGLIWAFRSSVEGADILLPGSQLTMEVWWADARSLSIGDTITVTAHYAGIATTPTITIIEVDGTVAFPNAWDSNPSLPSTLVDNAAMPSVGLISTNAAHAMIIVFMAVAAPFPNWAFGGGSDSFSPLPALPFAATGFQLNGDGTGGNTHPGITSSQAYTAYFDIDGGAQNNVTVIPFYGLTDYPTDSTHTLNYNSVGPLNLNGYSQPATFLMIVDAIAGVTFTPP